MVEEKRCVVNLLISQPRCFNLVGGMKGDAKKVDLCVQGLFPELVAAVDGLFFEHSPGRGNPAFTEDNTAFDVFVTCTTSNGQKGFIAIEVKYSETMTEPAATLRPRYEALSNQIGRASCRERVCQYG